MSSGRPLNTVIGFAKLLGEHQQRPLKDAEVVEYADLIRDAATASPCRPQRHPRHLQDAERQVHARCPRGGARGDPAGGAGFIRAARRPRSASRSRAGSIADLPPVKGDPGQAAPGVRQPDRQRHQVHAARRHGDRRGVHRRGRRRLGARARHGPGHDRRRDRRGADALRPGRRQPRALARRRRAGPADRQGPRAAARRTPRDPQRQVARHRGHRHAALAVPRCRTCMDELRRATPACRPRSRDTPMEVRNNVGRPRPSSS